MKRWAVLFVGGLAMSILCGMLTEAAAEKQIALMWVANVNPQTQRIIRDSTAGRVSVAMLNRLKEIAPDLKVITRMDLRDYQEADILFHEFQRSTNGIVFLRSGAAEYLATVKPKVPCFVGACNNPKLLGLIQNLEAPEGNITGVTQYVPYEQYFQAIRSLFPKVKRVALLVQRDDPGGAIDIEGTKRQCEALGLTYRDVVTDHPDELIKRAREVAGETDLLILSNTGLILDNTVNLVGLSNQTKVPLFSYAEKPVTLGAVAGLAARDEYLGRLLADAVFEVVVKDKPVRMVPVKSDPQPKLSINEGIMRSLGLTFPTEIMRTAEIIR